MHPLDRLKTAIEYLKSKDDTLTNESIADKLDYKAKNYVSDILSGNKNINKFFLAAIESGFGISAEWINTGKGKMLVENSETNDPKSDYKTKDYKEKYILQLEENNQLLKDLLSKTSAALEAVQTNLDAVYKNQVANIAKQLAMEDELLAYIAAQTNEDLQELKKRVRNKSFLNYTAEIQKDKKSAAGNVGR